MSKSDRKKTLKGISDAFGAQYDSDEDLTSEDQKEIRESTRPGKARAKAWEDEKSWKKIKKALKTAWYGDKRAKK